MASAHPLKAVPEAPRLLGFWMCLALVVGNMIGSGIFLLPATLAPYGLNAVIGWIVTIAGSLCLAAVLAVLARALPELAGPYDYIRVAFGSPPAFFVMWSYWISIWVTNAAISIAAVSYLSSLAPAAFAAPAVPALAASAFVLLFVGIACLGVRASGGVQIVTSVLKIVPLVGAVVLALVVFGGGREAAPFAPVPVGVAGISGAAALTLWAMLGFESAAVPAEKVRRPERTIPSTTLLGTLIVGLFYLAASTAVFLLLPAETAARSSAPFADLAGAFLGPATATLVVMFAAISCLGALNGWILLQAEVPLVMARRGVFPGWFGRVNRRGVPVRGQLTGAVLSIGLIASNYTRGLTELFAFMALLATVATLVLYLVSALAALRLRRSHPVGGAGIATLAVLGAIYSLWAFYGAGREATLWGAALLASGIPVYFLMRVGARSSRGPAAGRAALPE